MKKNNKINKTEGFRQLHQVHQHDRKQELTHKQKSEKPMAKGLKWAKKMDFIIYKSIN